MNQFNLDGQEFESFGKIPRMTKAMPMIITEKLDGTNAQIYIYPDAQGNLQLQAGSRKRWIYPGCDNYGFASWCEKNFETLIALLGEGRHFGEWVGPGIQKNIYALDEKRFYLFNTLRWGNVTEFPAGVGVVPVLHHGGFDSRIIEDTMYGLQQSGSHVRPLDVPKGGKPEGIIIYLPKSRQLFKRTFEYEEGKWGAK